MNMIINIFIRSWLLSDRNLFYSIDRFEKILAMHLKLMINRKLFKLLKMPMHIVLSLNLCKVIRRHVDNVVDICLVRQTFAFDFMFERFSNFRWTKTTCIDCSSNYSKSDDTSFRRSNISLGSCQ